MAFYIPPHCNRHSLFRVVYKMESGSQNILSPERKVSDSKMKLILLLLALQATRDVFCKPSVEDNSIFNIHGSLLSTESAESDDEEGGNR